MRIEPHANLAITLIRRNQFGSLRFRACNPGCPPPPNDLAYRLRVAQHCWPTYGPPCPPPLRGFEANVELSRPLVWPYDDAPTPLPWPREPATPPWPALPLHLPPVPPPVPRRPEQRGSLIDVLA